MQSDSNEARLGELIEKRRLRVLSEDERRELEALFERDAAAAALAERLDQEDQAMNQTITSAVDHFDFEKANRAIAARLKATRKGLLIQILMGSTMVALTVAVAWPQRNWELVLFVVVAVSMGVLGWLWVLVRRLSIARAAATSTPFAPVYERHLRDGRREFTILRACVVIGGLGFAILFIDSVVNGHFVKAILVALVLAALGPITVRRLFARSGAARHERSLTGDLTGTAWLRGEDDAR